MNSSFQLNGKKGIVIGIANDSSLAWGVTKIMKKNGAKDFAISYLNDKAKKYVEPLSQEVNAGIFMPLDYLQPGEMDAFFKHVAEKWGKIDFLVHSIAFCPINDLRGNVIDVSKEGFMNAVDVSCYSLIDFSRRAMALMPDGGSIITMTYYGSEKVVENYNIMGPIKAALESTVKYLSVDLGKKNIRINAISASPVFTRAASGLAEFDKMHSSAYSKSPIKSPITIEDVGNMGAFLISDASQKITGSVIFVDSGSHIIAY